MVRDADGLRYPLRDHAFRFGGVAAGSLGGGTRPFISIAARRAGIELPKGQLAVTTTSSRGRPAKAARDAAEAARLGITVDELKSDRRDEARRVEKLAARAKALGIKVKDLRQLINEGAEQP